MPSIPVRTMAAIVSGFILLNMPPMPSSSPPSSSGRMETGTRAAVAPLGAPKYLYVTPMRPPLISPPVVLSPVVSSRR